MGGSHEAVYYAARSCIDAICIFSPASAQGDAIVVGSKDFTEQRFLGYIILVALRENGYEVVDEIDLGDPRRATCRAAGHPD
ncbi:MAG: hypothetical protein HC915_18050 [Anaerolineae bacterium]|nr:hypothetical protein [Anaerolineae bacterium]